MRLTYALAAGCALVLASTATFAQTTVYNSAPTATYYFGANGTNPSLTNYSPANSAVLSATSQSGTDQVFARFHQRYPTSQFAPASDANGTYTFQLSQGAPSFDFGVTSAAGLSRVDGLITITNLGTGMSASFDPFTYLTDNVVSSDGKTVENSENFSFGFLSAAGFNTSTPDTYRLTFNVTGLASGTQTLTINAAFVPESATWAMMVMGFGMIGGALRARKTAFRLA